MGYHEFVLGLNLCSSSFAKVGLASTSEDDHGQRKVVAAPSCPGCTYRFDILLFAGGVALCRISYEGPVKIFHRVP